MAIAITEITPSPPQGIQKSPTGIAGLDEYDLEGLFIRLGFAIDSIGAKAEASQPKGRA